LLCTVECETSYPNLQLYHSQLRVSRKQLYKSRKKQTFPYGRAWSNAAYCSLLLHFLTSLVRRCAGLKARSSIFVGNALPLSHCCAKEVPCPNTAAYVAEYGNHLNTSGAGKDRDQEQIEVDRIVASLCRLPKKASHLV